MFVSVESFVARGGWLKWEAGIVDADGEADKSRIIYYCWVVTDTWYSMYRLGLSHVLGVGGLCFGVVLQ